MSGADPCLSVFLGEQQIASLQLSADQLLWHYAASWQQQGFALSPHLPLHGEIPPLNVQRFLRNLLPEGPGLEELLASFRLARHNTFALVQAIGQETAGALALLPAGQSPTDTTQFRPLSWPNGWARGNSWGSPSGMASRVSRWQGCRISSICCWIPNVAWALVKAASARPIS